VPIAKRLGLGSVLGYLVAGVVIGPFVLGFVGHTGGRCDALRRVWRGDDALLGWLGTATFSAIARPDSGTRRPGIWSSPSVSSLGFLANGSGGWHDPHCLQRRSCSKLSKRRLTKTEGGQSSFSVLLFQDAVIPMLALTSAGGEIVRDSTANRVIFVAAEQHGAALVGATSPAGDGNGRWHYCRGTVSDAPGLPLHCRYSVAGDFTATALLLVIGIALAMQQVGLSPALGTFVRSRPGG